ncbi:MAG: hypothetical protein PUB73_06325 [Bacteroidales bacterium]|nr:hypothetical protein [Bacteroidales bacterium]
MNKERKEELYEVVEYLEDASIALQEVRNEEQDAYDDLSEGLQYSRTGESMQNAIDEMDSIDTDIQKVIIRVNNMIKPPKKNKK